jgi:hypothetical protein
MLGPDPLPLIGGLLETPHPTPKTDKATVRKLYLQAGTKDTHLQTSDLTTTYLLWFPATALLGDPQEHFPAR